MSDKEKKFQGLVPMLLCFVTFLVFSQCSDQEKESERARTIRLLTNDDAKDWIVESIYVDDVTQEISICDSSYTLTLKSDFTWGEVYTYFSCYKKNTGSWALNEENNVISIQYNDQFNNQSPERKFEMLDLSENYFTYQYVQNNSLKRIRLKEIQ